VTSGLNLSMAIIRRNKKTAKFNNISLREHQLRALSKNLKVETLC
jgi:hypothetical protein